MPAPPRALDRYAVVIPADVAGPGGGDGGGLLPVGRGDRGARSSSATSPTPTSTSAWSPACSAARCDGRTPGVEPAVVEGAPPVPMEVRNWLIHVGAQAHRCRTGRAGCDGHRRAVRASTLTYPAAERDRACYRDAVVKATFSSRSPALDASYVHAARQQRRDRPRLDRSDWRWDVGTVPASGVLG